MQVYDNNTYLKVSTLSYNQQREEQQDKKKNTGQVLIKQQRDYKSCLKIIVKERRAQNEEHK